MPKLLPALALAAVLTGCSDSDGPIGNAGGSDAALRCTTPTDPASTLGSTFNMRFGGQSMVVGEGLSLTFAQLISDNRCALGAVCNTAGKAEVVVRVVDLNHNPADLDLSTETLTTARGTYQGFEVRLVRVQPYPEAGRARTGESGYCVELTVTRP